MKNYRILVHEIKGVCYYYDGKKLTKRVYASDRGNGGYVIGKNEKMTDADYKRLQRVNWRKVYNIKMKPLTRPERSEDDFTGLWGSDTPC